MRIAIDLDEVLANFLDAVIEFHNHTYQTTLKKSDFFTYDFWEIWGGNKKEAIQKIYNFHQTSYFKNITPVKDAIEVVKKLSQKHQLYIITSRQNHIQKETRKWVEKYFPNMFIQIYFTNHFAQEGSELKKSAVCDQLNIDVLIEDSPVYSEECFKPGRKIILIKYPWNLNYKLNKNIKKVSSWKDIDKIIE